MQEDSTLEVPFITDLDLTAEQWKQKYRETGSPTKRHCSKKDESLPPESESMRAAWKDYLIRVLPGSQRGVRNFLLAVMAEGRNAERDDTAAS